MSLKLLISIILFNLTFFLSSQLAAQENYLSEIHKYISLRYRSSEKVETYCKGNIAIVYIKIKNSKIDSVYSNNELGNLILENLQFIKNYKFKKHIDNPQIGLFFILKNVTANCAGVNNGFNGNAIRIEDFLKEIELNRRMVNFHYYPISILINTPQQ
jgi:hypothetical protein